MCIKMRHSRWKCKESQEETQKVDPEPAYAVTSKAGSPIPRTLRVLHREADFIHLRYVTAVRTAHFINK